MSLTSHGDGTPAGDTPHFRRLVLLTQHARILETSGGKSNADSPLECSLLLFQKPKSHQRGQYHPGLT